MSQTTQVFTDQGWQPRTQLGSSLAVASGTIDALGNVTINHRTGNILSIAANLVGNTLTVNFENPFDEDAIFFGIAFIYEPGVGTAPFLPLTQTVSSCVFSGTFPGAGPWNFAVFAIANS